MTSKTDETFDVIILGGGITGATAAAALQKLKLRTLIVEKTDLTNEKPGESLSPECRRHLRAINFRAPDSAVVDYYGISSIWGSRQIIDRDFICNPFGNGLAIDRGMFEKGLIKCAEMCGSRVFFNTEILTAVREKNFWRIETLTRKIKKIFRARLLILATGRSSDKLFNFSKRTYFDRLLALTCVIGSENLIPENTLRIESLRDGWFYTNQLPGERRVISIFTDSDLIPKSRSREDYFWRSVALSEWASEHNFQSPGKQNPIRTFDARTYFTHHQYRDGLLALGDTAYSIDPLSGQGIKKNLEMIEFVGPIIRELLDGDPASYQFYSDFNKHNFAGYLKEQNEAYRSENNFRSNCFWVRRHGLAQPGDQSDRPGGGRPDGDRFGGQ